MKRYCVFVVRRRLTIRGSNGPTSTAALPLVYRLAIICTRVPVHCARIGRKLMRANHFGSV